MRITKLIIILLIAISIYSCSDSDGIDINNYPIADFAFSPQNADTATIITFDASNSSDVEDPITSLKFSWDFEGKQKWTEPSSSAITSFRYKKRGTYNAKLRVIDKSGWTGNTTNSIIIYDTIP